MTAVAFWKTLARATATVAEHLEAEVSRHSLTLTEYSILDLLEQQGPMLLGAIQKEVFVSSGGITYLVDRLTAKRLVWRKQSPDDRRAKYAVLTPEGQALIRGSYPDFAACLEHALSDFASSDRAEAEKLLRGMITAVADVGQLAMAL